MERIRKRSVIVSEQETKIFIFGDNFSDTGNLFKATNGRIPPSSSYFKGRFSNGPLAVERLAKDLGLTLNPSTDFAIGGAQTGRENTNDTASLELEGVLDQVDRLANQVGAKGVNSKDLYVIWAGANDLLNQSSNSSATVDRAVDHVKTAVTRLTRLGARRIVVVQSPDLGRTPLSIETGRSKSLTQITRQFNGKLKTTLTQLDRQLDSQIIFSDLFQVTDKIVRNPSRFGFSNVTTAFLKDLVPVDPSADPKRFLFWDRINPTTAGHAIFADQIRQAIISNIKDDIQRVGTSLRDKLVGFAGNDRLCGRGGDDVLDGNGGRDLLSGGPGRDRLNGMDGRDLLVGGIGDDLLQGGKGLDVLFGGSGRDTLRGGDGVDFLSGGRGDDLLQGGRGCDLFVLLLRRGVDTIRDFEAGDRLLLLGRLKFGQLKIRQNGNDTEISIADTGRLLAILKDVKASSIGSDDFLSRRGDKTLFSLINQVKGSAGSVILDAIRSEENGLKDIVC